MSITIYEETLKITCLDSECPPEFDPGSFKKALESYKYLADAEESVPVVEFVFEKVIRYIESSTFTAVLSRVKSDMQNIPDVEAREIAEGAARGAVKELESGIYEEVIDILVSQNLAYRSISMNGQSDDVVRNSPQISMIRFVDIGGMIL